MTTYTEQPRIPAGPADEVYYPDSDGKPMAAGDLHREILTRTLDSLQTHYKKDPTVYVSGDILMYYVEGFPEKVVAPDVLVSFGIGMKPRHTYKVWEEGKVPEFAMELSSEETYRGDLSDKMELYASLGIRDYFLYDADDLYLPSQLMGFTLVDGAYAAIPAGESCELHSPALNLDFHTRDEGFGMWDPVAGKWLQTRFEAALERTERAAARRQKADEETARIREETARIQEETARIREETAQIREETAQIQEETAQIQEETAQIRKDTAQRRKEAARLREEIARLEAQR